MIATPINPKNGVYGATADYVHALEVRNAGRQLYVSGTMGLDASGRPGDSLDEQLELIWENLGRILAEAHMTLENVVRVTSYLTDAEFAQKNAAARSRALNGRLVPTTAIVVGTLLPDWLVEIEVIAVD